MERFFRFALVGDPVEHSRSPHLQKAALELAGLEGEYLTIRADDEVLRSTVSMLRSGELDGLNVTMPLKGSAFALCDRLTYLAERSGSVNSLKVEEGALMGHTTDAEAFADIYELLDVAARPLLVLGSGGSAGPALAAWPEKESWVSARDGAKAAAVARRFGSSGVIPWGDGLDGAVVVNATPLGMRGEDFPARPLDGAYALIDLPYGDTRTPASRKAEQAGIRCIEGREFLARQAAASFRWWTGVVVDSDALVAISRNV